MPTLQDIKSRLPEGNLRHDAQWLFSPKPLELPKGTIREISSLGHPLANFQRASESIYQRSKKGRLPAWIADTLDAGKPDWITAQQCSSELRDTLPRVIRPDLILTDSGLALSELDSVPGGMGITQWLSSLYTELGFDVIGGANGIATAFAELLDDNASVFVSDESKDYLPEMQYLTTLCSDLNLGDFHIKHADTYTADAPASSYRFFEWFDWENIPSARSLAASPQLTPPCKPHLEEKLWLALLWTPSLRKVWEQELRGKHLERIRSVIPRGWVGDPTPLSAHASIPMLDAHSWEDVAAFSQNKRELVLKISGFNELAWGSRGVNIGHDMPTDAWSAAISHAQDTFTTNPWMMQEFKHGALIDHPYFDPDTGEEKMMRGRARLCPYYFTNKKGHTSLGGILATIVPADKKKIHGMKDGILVPVMEC